MSIKEQNGHVLVSSSRTAHTGRGWWSVTWVGLGWVGFDLDVPPTFPAAQTILPYSYLPKQSQTGSGMFKIKVNPTHVTNHYHKHTGRREQQRSSHCTVLPNKACPGLLVFCKSLRKCPGKQTSGGANFKEAHTFIGTTIC